MTNQTIPSFPQLVFDMHNPQKRQEWVNKLPSNIQRLIQDREYAFQVLGQDGVQLFADQENFMMYGIPIPPKSMKISQDIENKLLQMMNSGQSVATI